jgi:hypothetical protein
MTPQEYIITEEQIVKIGEAMTKWYLPDAAGSLCFLLRSRPITKKDPLEYLQQKSDQCEPVQVPQYERD